MICERIVNLLRDKKKHKKFISYDMQTKSH